MKIILLFVAAYFSAALKAGTGPKIFDGISAHQDRIVLAWANRLWMVSDQGGKAHVIYEGSEVALPVFSPDGTRIAFTQNAGRNYDVFVVSAQGGEAKRVTFHPQIDIARGWTPDKNAVLFWSGRTGKNKGSLYRIAVDGGLVQTLPIPEAYKGSLAPNGRELAYAPWGWPVEYETYRHYRGGLTSPFWIVDLENGQVEVIRAPTSNNTNFIWLGESIYFTSDEQGAFNLYRHHRPSKQTTALTHFDFFGIRHLGGVGDQLAFTRSGKVYSFDTNSSQISEIEVDLEVASPEKEPKDVNALDYTEHFDLAADGKQILLEARGDMLLYNLENATYKAITQTSSVADREPAISPDGRLAAWFSDGAGSYQLIVHDLERNTQQALGVGESEGYYRQPVWSPDSRLVAFSGNKLGLWLANVESGLVRRIDQSEYLAQGNWNPSWSTDSRYLAYAKGRPNHMRDIFIFDTKQDKVHQITHDTHASWPVFDPNGKYLYYLAGNLSPFTESNQIWGLLSSVQSALFETRKVHAVSLQNHPSPFIHVFNEPHPEAQIRTKAEHTEIEFEGIHKRILPLPLPERNYARLASGGPGLIYLQYVVFPGTSGGKGRETKPLAVVDLSQKEHFHEIAADVVDFSCRKDMVLFATNRGLYLHKQGDEARELNLNKVMLRVDPKAEWWQIFHEAWRMMRLNFYDPNHHGQDLSRLEKHYLPFLAEVPSREGLNALIKDMLGQVSVSHLSVGGGDQSSSPSSPRVGTLGADYVADGDYVRISKIYRRGTASSSNRSSIATPLDQPGLDIQEGDYILAIDAVPVRSNRPLHAYLEGKAYQKVNLTVASQPDGEIRHLTVVPINGEDAIRTEHWFQERRQMVARLSENRIGYIALANYGLGGVDDFMRQYALASQKEAVIIDQRYNGGGYTADTLVQMLTRVPYHRYAFPHGAPLSVPNHTTAVPKALLINQANFSAAETFPLMFQIAEAGILVGTRTGGGGTGTALFQPSTIDGGRLRIPNRGGYNPKTGDFLENVGVIPDIEVEQRPDQWQQGRDMQLEAAVQSLLQTLNQRPASQSIEPRFPVHN